jgi:O-6-methylguanine DNA methyltransferase
VKIELYVNNYNSPFGRIILLSTEKGLCYVTLPGREEIAKEWTRKVFGTNDFRIREVERGRALEEIEAYFIGKLRGFSIPLDIRGTLFQKKVWDAIKAIPYGQTCSYGDIARAIGNPKAFRAVGMANAENPLPIFIPCHRVIRSDGLPGGYGGGLELKKYLLALEARFLDSQRNNS